MIPIFIYNPGVLGVIEKDTEYGAYATWFLDGIRFKSWLEPNEYVTYKSFGDPIDD